MAITPVPASRAAGGEIEVQAREAGQAAAEAVAGVVATLAAAAVVAFGVVEASEDSFIGVGRLDWRSVTGAAKHQGRRGVQCRWLKLEYPERRL